MDVNNENGIKSEEVKHDDVDLAEEELKQIVPNADKKIKSKKTGMVFLIITALILLAIPSALMIWEVVKENKEQILRSEMVDYLTFSYALHLRSYWAMTNLDYALEAARNDGDYGKTTMYLPLYVKRARRQVSLAQEEIRSFGGEIPLEARVSYNLLKDCFDELEDISDELHSIPPAVVPYGELITDSIITTWGGREAVRVRFDLRAGRLSEIRQNAVTYGYDWLYEDMRLKAFYNIQMSPGQNMFSSSLF